MTEQEHTQISARAAATGLSIPAWLVAAGLANLSPNTGEHTHGGISVSTMSAPERHALTAEFVAAHRLLRGAATNLNQLAAAWNSTGELAPQAAAVLDQVDRVTARLDELTQRLGGRAAAPARRAQAS
ncbi:MobC family plasmid mobilization relaxosome protein [Kineosporia rhizophila]|uniref:plasmid mobilization relaxosome protein MobC n=1 Tax=Kineosporia rhizophila TaxID=84633 RepID=UPI001E419F1F|nr:plasmid mobilization relaxosome protein MobC [Kineosporia rhizophila]MCE0540405.1 MobC family plasmid mobilization relaxosome protein [Kineosporia rhizophila]